MYSSNPPHPTLKNRPCKEFPSQQERIDFSLANAYEKKHPLSYKTEWAFSFRFLLDKIDFSLANPHEKKHRPTLPK